VLIPDSLKIGGHTIKVSVEDLSKENIAGEFDSSKNLIRIAAENTTSQQEATLFHEIFHVLNSEMGGEGYAHALLESLSQQIYAVLKDNDMLK
jgi:hypothetical protein